MKDYTDKSFWLATYGDQSNLRTAAHSRSARLDDLHMLGHPAAALAHPNIALIKYWGDLDPKLHIPANGSISICLEELFTRTTVQFEQGLKQDRFTLDDNPMEGAALTRVHSFLDRVRKMAGITHYAQVESWNNFPTGAGIASSASGFAALALAGTHAAGLELDEADVSRLARTGSGSACRSIPGGFVEWQAGNNDHESFAYSIAPPEHWDLADCIALVSLNEKSVSSSTGHALALTSPLQAARVEDTSRRLELCRRAIKERNFNALTEVVELDSNLMHAVMISSHPPLFYWQPETVSVVQAVLSMRKDGLPVCYTIDAGPNVHVICTSEAVEAVSGKLRSLAGVRQVLVCHPGGPARIE